MRLADLASILAQGCTLWTDSFKLSGTPARSGGFRFYKKRARTARPQIVDKGVVSLKRGNSFLVQKKHSDYENPNACGRM